MTLVETLIKVYKQSAPISFNESNGAAALDWANRMVRQLQEKQSEKVATHSRADIAAPSVPQAAITLEEPLQEEVITHSETLKEDATVPKPGSVTRLNPSQLLLDPRFRSGNDRALETVTEWSDRAAGIVQVWYDKSDEQTYVVNGFNRVNLAQRSGVDKISVRYLEAEDVNEAFLIGALTNFAEGRSVRRDALFTITESGINDADFAEIDVSLNCNETLDFARLKMAGNTKKTKTCTKGFSCGFACISRNKACAGPLPGQAKNYADWLVGQIARGGPFSPAHTKEAQQRGLIKPVKPADSVQRKTTEFAQKWSTAFDNAPDDLKRAIARIDEPDGAISLADTAFYRSGYQEINMDGYSIDDKGLTATAVYRHEYGHHLDYKLGEAQLVKALAEVAPEVNVRSHDDFEKLPDSEQKSLAKSLYSRLGYDAAEEVRYISGTPKGRKAIDADNGYLAEKVGRLEETYLSAHDDLLDKYKIRPLAKKRYGIDDNEELGVGQKADLGKKLQLAEIEEELQNSKLYPADADFKTKSDLMRQHYDAAIRSELEGKPDVYRLLYEERTNRGESSILFGAKMIQAARNDDPQLLADMADSLFDSVNTNDLIGSITLNTVGRGHSTNYYFRTGDSYDKQGTEAFANLTDLHGQNTSLSKALASHLAPNTYKFMQEALRGN